MAQPMGMPLASVSTDHFQPELRSVSWVLARSFASSGAFVQGPIDGHLGEVEADDLVVGRIASSAINSKMPASIHSSRRARAVVSETLRPQSRLGIFEAAPRHQAHQHHPKQSRSEARGR